MRYLPTLGAVAQIDQFHTRLREVSVSGEGRPLTPDNFPTDRPLTIVEDASVPSVGLGWIPGGYREVRMHPEALARFVISQYVYNRREVDIKYLDGKD